jgi:hypothetical protein
MNLKTKPLILAFLFTVSIQVIGFAQGKFIADNQAINRNIFADKQLEISVCDTKNKLMDLHSYIFSKGIFENFRLVVKYLLVGIVWWKQAV